MPHDKRGIELNVGDVVMVPCRVTAIHLTEDYCNVDLEITIPMPPQQTVQSITLNSRQTLKPTGSHRYYEYGEGVAVSENTSEPESLYTALHEREGN